MHATYSGGKVGWGGVGGWSLLLPLQPSSPVADHPEVQRTAVSPVHVPGSLPGVEQP